MSPRKTAKPTTPTTSLLLTSLPLLFNNLAATNADTTVCSPSQAALVFTLQTDAKSTIDNSWHITHAESGETIIAESVDSNDAVISRTVCVDASSSSESESAGSATTHCYDLELQDDFGDGLTLPHSQSGGTAGGWSLSWNDQVVAQHAPPACLLEDVSGQYNKCAEEFGFEYCGVRVCDTPAAESSSDGEAGGGSGGISVSNLKGSQCQLVSRTCPAMAATTIADMTSGSTIGTAKVTVEVTTDSYSDEFSWEVRKSYKSNALETSGDLILAGGNAVYDEEGELILGMPGMGAELDDNEMFTSTTCQPDSKSYEECYDFRAYDSYGDGLGCGSDGSIAITISGSLDSTPIAALLQQDDNIARMARVDSQSKLACLNQEGLTKWSYCAIRICNDGDVIRLPGNECSFGADVLLDPDADGAIQPFNTPLLEAPMAQSSSAGNGIIIKPQSSSQQEEDEDLTKAEEFASDLDAEFMTMGLNSEPLELNSAGANQEDDEDEDEGMSLAEQYQAQSPYEYQTQELQEQNQDAGGKGKGNGKKDNDKKDNFNQLKPNSQSAGKNENPKKDKNDKVDSENEYTILAMRPQSQQFSEALTNFAINIEPFYATLLPIDSEHELQYYRPQSMSNAVPPYLMNYLDANIEGWRDDNAPIGFDLVCTKDKKEFTTEDVRWVMKCEGEALFDRKPLPKKALMNDLVHQAFAGEFHEEFLEFMYPTYREDDKAMKKQQLKEQIKLQKEQMKLNSQFVDGFNIDEDNGEKARNEIKQQKKEELQQLKMEKQAARKKQMEKRQQKKDKREEKQQQRQNENGGRLLRVRTIE